MKLEKIMSMTLAALALDVELESTDLAPGKREKIEARLKKLLDKKNKLIHDIQPEADEHQDGQGQHQN